MIVVCQIIILDCLEVEDMQNLVENGMHVPEVAEAIMEAELEFGEKERCLQAQEVHHIFQDMMDVTQ